MQQIRIATVIIAVLLFLSACGDKKLHNEAQESFGKGDYSKAKVSATALVNKYPKSKYASLAQEILQKLDAIEAEEQRKRLEERLKELIEALNNRETRRDAIRELGEIGDKRAVEPLIEALKYESARDHVIEALGKIGDKRAVEPLIAILRNKKYYAEKAAVIALGKLGDNRAIIPLVDAFKTEYWEVRDEIKNALIKFGEPAVEPIIAALQINNFRNFRTNDYDARCIVVETATEINKNLSIEPLILLLKNEADWHVQKCIATALGNIGDKRAVAPLIEVLNSASRDRSGMLGTNSAEATAAMDIIVTALEKITNQDFGRDSKKWKEWWKENKVKTKG